MAGTPIGKVRGICIHHTASPRATTTYEQIRHEHVTVNGWTDVGYHHLILGDGSIKTCRPPHLQGAGALGYNAGVLHIAMAGNFELEAPTPQQIRALQQLLAVLCKRHNLPETAIIGHCDVYRTIVKFARMNGRLVSTATACPGRNLYRLLGVCREVVRGYLTAKKGA